MPNGDPHWLERGLPEMERYFSKMAPVLEDFAQAHNLLIDKYYHHGADWTFRFRHPKGGSADILVIRNDQNNVYVAGAWQVSDYDTCTMYSKVAEPKVISQNAPTLRTYLHKTLTLILSWAKTDLTVCNADYSEWKTTWTKQEFESFTEKYPFPKP